MESLKNCYFAQSHRCAIKFYPGNIIYMPAAKIFLRASILNEIPNFSSSPDDSALAIFLCLGRSKERYRTSA
jgi:hypothetical protein